MTEGERVAAAAMRLYEAVLDESRWPAALDAVADAAGSHHTIAAIGRHAPARVDAGLLISTRIESRYSLMLGAAQGDAAALTAALPARQVVRHQSLVPLDQLVRTEFYNEVIRPMGGHFGVAVKPFASPAAQCLVTVCRPEAQGDLSDREIAIVQALVPHVANALQLRERVAGAALATQRSFAAFEQLDIGAVLIDQDGRACFVNRSAEAILRDGDGLALGPAGLAAARGDDTRRLRALIAAAIGGGTAHRGSWRLRLERPSMRRPYAVRVAPLAGIAEPLLGSALPCAAVFIADPDRRSALDARAMEELYDLTAGEAAVAVLLAEGRSLPEIAVQLGMTRETVRTYLKRAFTKTDTASQAALVALVLRSRC